MKIVIAAATGEGLLAPVSAHFGSAPYFVIADTATTSIEIFPNPGTGHEHGQCRPLAGLPLAGVGAVVCSGLGVRALQLLNAQGIKVYRGTADTVGGAWQQYAAGQLTELAASDACTAHRCG